MLFITRLLDRRKVWKLLPEYPTYRPPHTGGWEPENWITKSQAQENYEYFLEQKEKRIQYLADFLMMFKVNLKISDGGLVDLSKWMYRFGAYLRDTEGYQKNAVKALELNQPTWSGELAGLNIIHDASIFCGECIVRCNKDAKWSLFTGNYTKNNHQKLGFNKPWIDNVKHWGEIEKIYTFGEIDECVNHRWNLICNGSGSPSYWHDPMSLARIIRYYASDEENPVRPDYPEGWNGPLGWFGPGPPIPASRIAALKNLDAVSRLKPFS